jgi:DNA-binding CsgD family transcriptional regulator
VTNKLDGMEQLIIYRCNNGIKLINPALEQAESPLVQKEQRTGHTVGEILDLPFNFYFLNTQGETQLMNAESARMCGFKSVEDSLGKSLQDVSLEQSANTLIDNCATVINEGILKIFEEENVRKDGTSLNFLSIKCPWYDYEERIQGVFGCSIVLGKHGLASSLSTIVSLGLFDSTQIPLANPVAVSGLKINKSYLSKREIECLQLTIKGYTAKRIARELNISHRTVEEYLFNIRVKTGTSSKSELIEMTIDQFMPMVFPS